MPASLALTGAMNDIINECAMRTLWGVWAKDVLVIRSWPASEIAGLPASSWREPCVRGLDLRIHWSGRARMGRNHGFYVCRTPMYSCHIPLCSAETVKKNNA